MRVVAGHGAFVESISEKRKAAGLTGARDDKLINVTTGAWTEPTRRRSFLTALNHIIETRTRTHTRRKHSQNTPINEQ